MKFFRRMGRLVWLLAMPALFYLFLAACEKKPEPPTGPPEKITIACPASMINVLPYIAFKKNFFSDEGLKVELQLHELGKTAVKAMLDKKADLAVSADTPVMFAITGGQEIRIVAEIAASAKATAIVARKDGGIASPADLRGKRIGVPVGTTADFFLDSFLSMRGIARNDLVIVDIKPGEMLDALLKGEVDAVSVWEPFLKRIQRQLQGRVVSFYDETLYNDIGCVSGRREFVGMHPEAIRKALKALIRAGKFARMNPEEAQRLIAEFTGTNADFVRDIWDIYVFRVSLDQSLLVNLEDQTRWVQRSGRTKSIAMPNYLDYIYFDGLKAVKPEAVRIIR